MKDLAKKYKTLLSKKGINTPLRLSHFFAQIHHESGGGLYLKELGKDSYFSKYEGREDLGNTQKGDGLKYKGRGFIQITGRSNYSELSKFTGIDFVSNPELLEEEANAMISAIWFWNKRGLNALADKDAIRLITRKINGGYNGLSDRISLLAKYKKIFS